MAKKKGLDYQTVKACFDAQRLLAAHNDPHPQKLGDRTYGLGQRSYYSTPPFQVVYSQQEIVICPSVAYKDWALEKLMESYPDGVTREFYRSPDKEYISFLDVTGVRRYNLIPEDGIRIQADGSGYKVMNPVQDYHISVDRAKAAEARKPAEDLYDYINTLWDMVPDPASYNDRPSYGPGELPAIDDRDKWYEYVYAAKWSKYDTIAKSTVLARIRSEYTEKALAYKVTPVPDTETSHSAHWDKLEDLRKAGMLEPYEGKFKPKKKRVKKPKEKKETGDGQSMAAGSL
jgi:hypothetical protein